MIGALARKFFGSANDRRVKGYQSRVDAINALEPQISALSDEALKERTAEFRKALAEGKTLARLHQRGVERHGGTLPGRSLIAPMPERLVARRPASRPRLLERPGAIGGVPRDERRERPPQVRIGEAPRNVVEARSHRDFVDVAERPIRCAVLSAAGADQVKIDNAHARIRTWWVLCIIFGLTLVVGPTGSLVLFGLISFLALREYITLVSTHRADHHTPEPTPHSMPVVTSGSRGIQCPRGATSTETWARGDH